MPKLKFRRQKKYQPKITEIIDRIIDYTGTCETMTVQQLKDFFGDRGFAIAIIIFNMPSVLPTGFIPGSTTIFAIPVIFFAFQMLIGMKAIWLPRRFLKKYYPTETKRKILLKAKGYLTPMEKYIKPRYTFITGANAERFIALFIIFLALVVALPIPGANFIPALGISILALGLLEKDGLITMIGIVYSIIAVALVSAYIIAALKLIVIPIVSYIISVFPWLAGG